MVFLTLRRLSDALAYSHRGTHVQLRQLRELRSAAGGLEQDVQRIATLKQALLDPETDVTNHATKRAIFGFGAMQSIRALMEHAREAPETVADLLATQNLNDHVARAIVADLFPRSLDVSIFQDWEASCVRFITRCLEVTAPVLDREALPFRLIRAYYRDRGVPYLRHTIQEVVRRIIGCREDLHEAIQLAPDMGDDDDDEAEKGKAEEAKEGTSPSRARASSAHARQKRAAKQLLQLCRMLIDRIIASVTIVPTGMREVARRVVRGRHQAEATDSSSSVRAVSIVGDLFFLPFLVQAVMFPEKMGLCGMAPITERARRNLQCVGAVLIKLVTGSDFAYGGKTQQRSQLNTFLHEHIPRVGVFCDAFVAGAAEWGEHGGSLLLDPLCMQSRDVIHVHRALASMLNAPPAGTDMDAVAAVADGVAQRLNLDATTKARLVVQYSVLQVLCANVSRDIGKASGDAEYVVVSAGLPQGAMSVADTAKAQGSSWATTPQLAAVVGVLRKCVSATLPLELCAPEQDEKSDMPLLCRTLMGASHRARGANREAVAVLLAEAATVLAGALPTLGDEWTRNDGLPLLKKILEDVQQGEKDPDLSNSSSLLLLEYLVKEARGWYRMRAAELTAEFHDMELRRYLTRIMPTMSAFKAFVYNRLYIPSHSDASSSPERLRAFVCGGQCPVSVSEDLFVCSRCLSYMRKSCNIISQFVNKYCQARPAVPPLAHGVVSLEVTDPQRWQERVYEHIVDVLREEVTRRCKKADKLWRSSLEALNQHFDSFSSFFVFVSARRETQTPNRQEVDGIWNALARDVDVVSAASQAADRQVALWRQTPLMGSQTEDAVVRQLRNIPKSTLPRNKLRCLEQCVSTLSVTLSVPSLQALLASDGVQEVGASQVGADHIMVGLAFAVMRANPEWLLSDMQQLRLLASPLSGQSKAFLDVMVAIRMISGLTESLLHILPPTPIQTARSVHAPPSNIVLLPPDDRLAMKLKCLGYPATAVHVALRAMPEALVQDDLESFVWCRGFLAAFGKAAT